MVETIELRSKFSVDEIAFINQSGEGEITGQAFLRRNDGMVVYAAGMVVTLVPAGKYANERIHAMYGNAKTHYRQVKFSPDYPDYRRMTRQTKANGEGRFSFSNLADGDYHIVVLIYWKPGDSYQGGSIRERVTIKDGGKVDVIMNGE